MERGEAVFAIAGSDSPDVWVTEEHLHGDGYISIAATAHDDIDLAPGPRIAGQERAGATLLMRRDADLLSNCLKPDLAFQVDVEDQGSLMRMLLERMAAVHQGLTVEAITEALLRREQVNPSTLGNAVAAPHMTHDSVTAQMCAIAHVPGGLSIAERDEPVYLVFLLISPTDELGDHLQVRAHIARSLENEETRSLLTSASRPEDMVDIMRRLT